MFPNLHLLLVRKLVEYFTKLSINHRFTRSVIRAIDLVVSSSQRWGYIFHVELQMSEKVNIFSGLKGTKGVYSTIYRRVDQNLTT